MTPWILLALLGLAAPAPPAAPATEVHAVWLSYPWWRLPKEQKEGKTQLPQIRARRWVERRQGERRR